eukprot:a510087_46.p1 GENE.a510087_46~~a510087_46.p1  ORF type:complete len:365 (+),score=151.11 a510087_46:38-1096(+)
MAATEDSEEGVRRPKGISIQLQKELDDARDALRRQRESESLRPDEHNETIRRLRQRVEQARLAVAEAVVRELVNANGDKDSFSLESRGFRELPNIFQLKGLRRLDISYNLIETLDRRFFDYLPLLEEFRAVQNKLTELPNSIESARSLRILDVRWNFLTTLPEALFLCTTLTELHVSYNRIEQLGNVSRLTALQELAIDANPLLSMPALTDMKALRVLAMSALAQAGPDDGARGRRLDWPKDLERCSALQELYAVENNFTELPKELTQLTELRKLVVRGNLIRGVPSLLSLTKLELCDLSRNDLGADRSKFRTAVSAMPHTQFIVTGNGSLTYEQLTRDLDQYGDVLSESDD